MQAEPVAAVDNAIKELARDPAFELSRERVGDDELVTIRSHRLDSRTAAVLGIRVGRSGVLVSVADSQALELSLDEIEADLSRIVTALRTSQLYVLRDAERGVISRLRGPGFEFVLPVRYRRSHSAWVNVDSLGVEGSSD